MSRMKLSTNNTYCDGLGLRVRYESSTLALQNIRTRNLYCKRHDHRCNVYIMLPIFSFNLNVIEHRFDKYESY